MTKDQKVKGGKKMFSIFATQMLKQRVLQTYRERVAQERQSKLLRELKDEGTEGDNDNDDGNEEEEDDEEETDDDEDNVEEDNDEEDNDKEEDDEKDDDEEDDNEEEGDDGDDEGREEEEEVCRSTHLTFH